MTRGRGGIFVADDDLNTSPAIERLPGAASLRCRSFASEEDKGLDASKDKGWKDDGSAIYPPKP